MIKLLEQGVSALQRIADALDRIEKIVKELKRNEQGF